MIRSLKIIIEIIINALHRENIINDNELKKCIKILSDYKKRNEEINKPDYSEGVGFRKANMFFKAAKLVNLKRELTNKEARILAYCQRNMND